MMRQCMTLLSLFLLSRFSRFSLAFSLCSLSQSLSLSLCLSLSLYPSLSMRSGVQDVPCVVGGICRLLIDLERAYMHKSEADDAREDQI